MSAMKNVLCDTGMRFISKAFLRNLVLKITKR